MGNIFLIALRHGKTQRKVEVFTIKKSSKVLKREKVCIVPVKSLGSLSDEYFYKNIADLENVEVSKFLSNNKDFIDYIDFSDSNDGKENIVYGKEQSNKVFEYLKNLGVDFEILKDESLLETKEL